MGAAIECSNCILEARGGGTLSGYLSKQELNQLLENRHKKIVEASYYWSESLEPYSPGISLKVELVDAAWLLMEHARRSGRGDIARDCLRIILEVYPDRFPLSDLHTLRRELGV